VLNYIGGHEVKDAINPDMKAISDMNTQKKQTAELKAYEKRILAEELAKIKNEEDFNKWLQQAEYMA
jgi:cytochrome b involved in lipid metabolism